MIRRELENHLVDRALRDRDFRQLLIANPKAALESELARLNLDIKLPSNLKVKMLEEKPDTLYLVLPPDLAGSDAPSDEEMLAVVRALKLDQ